MNETRKATLLQRLPLILAVTAASYGLQVQARTEPARPASGGAKAAADQPAGASTAPRGNGR
jgi:hypothetical protein